MREYLLAIALALSMTMIVPAAAADDVAGASGQCFDDDGSGGGGHVAVTDDPDASTSGLTDVSPDDPTPSVVDGVIALADGNGDPASGNGCTSEDSSQQDYLEVHAAGNQVCYDGEVNTDNSCQQRPG